MNEVEHGPRKAFHFHRSKGRWWFTIYGWGIRYKDSRRHLPNYDERIKVVKNFRLGPHWFRLLRP